jgi:hypothetical protein
LNFFAKKQTEFISKIMNVKQYLAKIGAKGGKAKSEAKTAAARKANAARWRNHQRR